MYTSRILYSGYCICTIYIVLYIVSRHTHTHTHTHKVFTEELLVMILSLLLRYPISRIVSTSAVPTVSQPPAKSSASDPSIIARSAPPTVQPPQPATPPTSKKGRHSIVVGTVSNETYITIAPKRTKDRGALLRQ